jgi:diguanylate cyclase (GGDEF)-like protein
LLLNLNYLLYVPDLAAMLVLMMVLVFLRRRSDAKDVTLWLVGLCFIFVEAVASDAYRFTPVKHAASHSIALVAYVLAGLTFAWAARKDSVRVRDFQFFCVATGVPLVALATLYGTGVKVGQYYLGLIVAGILLGLVGTVVFLRTARFTALALVLQALLWVPMIWMVKNSSFRALTYWGLGYLYLLVAAALWGVMKRSRIGGAVMVSGFVLYALCLFTHPYLPANSIADLLNDQIWTLQKFFVTIGLLLVLLDEQSQRNEGLALQDALTGLPNRRLFDDRMGQAIERCERFGTQFAVFTIDLDGFKAVNDALGHRKGDEVLREAASRLSRVVRSADTLARCGGDEFCVITNDISEPTVCDRIAEQLSKSLAGFGDSVRPDLLAKLSCSVGYALYPGDARDATQLQEVADRRMYAAKRAAQEVKVKMLS